jgi:hypothetical protein
MKGKAKKQKKKLRLTFLLGLISSLYILFDSEFSTFCLFIKKFFVDVFIEDRSLLGKYTNGMFGGNGQN